MPCPSAALESGAGGMGGGVSGGFGVQAGSVLMDGLKDMSAAVNLLAS